MKVHGKRAMLNKPGNHSTAAIVAEVEDTSKWKPGCDADGEPVKRNGYKGEPHCAFSISDCSRSIGFDLDWHNEDARKNALHKVDTMIAVLTAFRAGLSEEQKRYVERMRHAVDE